MICDSSEVTVVNLNTIQFSCITVNSPFSDITVIQ